MDFTRFSVLLNRVKSESLIVYTHNDRLWYRSNGVYYVSSYIFDNKTHR